MGGATSDDGAESLAARLRDAAELSAMGRDRSALSLLRPLVAEHPDDATVRCHLAMALLRSGSWKSALREAEHATGLARASEEGLAQHLRGAALLRCGRPAEAVEALRRAVAMSPDDVGILAELATAQCASGDAAAALGDATRATQLRPDAAPAHNAVALSLLALSRWSDAEAAARRVLQISRGDVQASNNLALALAAQERRGEALAFLRSAWSHSLVMRTAHRVVGRNQRLLGGDDRRGGLRTAAANGQLEVVVFCILFAVYGFLRSPWVLPVLVIAAAVTLRAVVFRGAGGGRVRTRGLVALPDTARVRVPLPPKR